MQQRRGGGRPFWCGLVLCGWLFGACDASSGPATPATDTPTDGPLSDAGGDGGAPADGRGQPDDGRGDTGRPADGRTDAPPGDAGAETDGGDAPRPDTAGTDGAGDAVAEGLADTAPSETSGDVHPLDAGPRDVPLGDGDGHPTDADGPDARPSDAERDGAAHTDTDTDAGPMRRWAFRGIGGASMGGMSLLIALDHPKEFDIVTPLGAYFDFTYLMHFLKHHVAAGFCPREQLLANLDHINEADNPEVFCGPVPPALPFEEPVDFNHFRYTNNGGSFDRDFYFDVFDGFMLVLGNFMSYNPASPFIPAGLDYAEFAEAQLDEWCGPPLQVGLPFNLNAEYNPDGAYPLTTFCDGEEPVGCYEDDPNQCGENHPDFWELMGAYDPTYPNHRRAVRTALAVDYNGNGLRDYGEPIVINDGERYRDTGPDGCSDSGEDGHGGCLPTGQAGDPGDPNGDNYDMVGNPLGSEGNWVYDAGEPFLDAGIDGVWAPAPYAPDHGEGNGVYDASPNFARSLAIDAHQRAMSLPIETLENLDFYIDGGIRDFMNAATASTAFVGALRARGIEVRQYEDFVATEAALMPGATYGQYSTAVVGFDFAPERYGRNLFVRYGDPNATPEAIRAGDGGHVGSEEQALARMLTAFFFALRRFPDPSPGEPGHSLGPAYAPWTSYYSEAMQSRRRFAMALPPGYYDADQAAERFPVYLFLHGHGMTPQSLGGTASIIGLMTKTQRLPRAILLFPDGRCCYRHMPTGRRECACESAPDGMKACLDPDCRGPHETCAERLIPRAELEQECFEGSFFLDLLADRWGDPEAARTMRYGEAVMDLIHHVDANYRTRQPADYPR